MAAVKSLCTRGIVMEDGKIVYDGEIVNAVSHLGADSKSLNHKFFFVQITILSTLNYKKFFINPKSKTTDDALDEDQ
jgi:lipopolysaccharide transport system ATP-binding protein